jgi:hypothetical protein
MFCLRYSLVEILSLHYKFIFLLIFEFNNIQPAPRIVDFGGKLSLAAFHAGCKFTAQGEMIYKKIPKT